MFRLNIFITVLATISMVSCAPKDEKLKPESREEKAVVAATAPSQLSLARHLVGTLEHARLLVDDAFYKMNVRQTTEASGNGDAKFDDRECRKYIKTSPRFDKPFNTHLESFQVLHLRCSDFTGSEKVKRAEMYGTEEYDISWQLPYPKHDDPATMLPGHPELIIVTTQNLRVDLVSTKDKAKDVEQKVSVIRNAKLRAELVDHDATTLTYRVTYTGTNELDSRERGYSAKTEFSIKETIFKVDKTQAQPETIWMQAGPMEMIFHSEREEKKQVAVGLASVKMQSEGNLMRKPNDCEPFGGTYKGTHEGRDIAPLDFNFKIEDWQLKVASEGSETALPIALCNRQSAYLEPVFREDFEAVYLWPEF